jgi:hypothetical protein
MATLLHLECHPIIDSNWTRDPVATTVTNSSRSYAKSVVGFSRLEELLVNGRFVAIESDTSEYPVQSTRGMVLQKQKECKSQIQRLQIQQL